MTVSHSNSSVEDPWLYKVGKVRHGRAGRSGEDTASEVCALYHSSGRMNEVGGL